MKVILVSDSHGFTDNIIEAIEKEPDCDTIFFLGDGISDIEKCIVHYPQKKFFCVKGNNDYWDKKHDIVAYKYLEGNTIVYTHGHTFDVRRTLSDLADHAQSVMAGVAFYGHTHKADIYYDGYKKVYMVNPGAICSGNYAVVTLNEKGADAKLKTIF